VDQERMKAVSDSLAVVCAPSFLKCFDTIGRVTGRLEGHPEKKTATQKVLFWIRRS